MYYLQRPYIYVILHTYVYIYYYLQQLHVCDTTHIYVLKHIVAHRIVVTLSIIMTILTTIYKLHDTYSCSLRSYIYFHIYTCIHTHTNHIQHYDIILSSEYGRVSIQIPTIYYTLRRICNT